MGFILHGLAAWISGYDNPAFASPGWLRLSLAFGVWTVALVTARLSTAMFCWLWLAALATVCSIWLPGATPYFLFPSLVAAPLLLASVRYGRELALFVAALAGLVIWLSFTAIGEFLIGLGLHEMFTASAAFGLIAVLPLLRKSRDLGLSAIISLFAALALAVAAGFQPPYSRASPQRLNLRYVERDGKAWWLADPVQHLPDALHHAAHFSAYVLHFPATGYVASAGTSHLAAPDANVSRHGSDVIIDLKAPGDGITLQLPRAAKLKSLKIAGIETPAEGAVDTIACVTPDCGEMQMTLHLGTTAAFDMLLQSVRRGLPPEGMALLKARPPQAVPSQSGDVTLLMRKIIVPAG